MIARRLCILAWIMMIGLATAAMAADLPLTVSGIEVEGNVEIQTKKILDVVPFHVGDTISNDDLKEASQAIYDLGWFSEVIPTIDDAGSILFHVVENPVLKTIEITGNVNTEPFEIFGITLFSTPIMPSDKIRRILRENGVKPKKVLNNKSLEEGLQAVIDAYGEKGYILIMVGKVTPGATLSIEIIEGRVTANMVSGLGTVPEEIAQEMIDLPIGVCLKRAPIQQILARFKKSVFFSDVNVVLQQGATPDEIRLLWALTERRLIENPIEINGITLAGVTLFPHEIAESSLGEIPLGSIDNYALLQIVQGLYDLYYRTGYVMVRLSVGPIAEGVLPLTIEEGKIGDISIAGNDHTKDYVIMKTLDIHEGEILNQGRLAVAYQGLMSLGYFRSLDIVPEWVDDRVSLSIAIVENKKLGGINGSIAFSPESGGLVGKLDYHQNNLLGTGQDLSFSYSRGLIGDKSAVWDLGYSTVAYFQDFNRVGFDLYRKSDEKTVEEDKTQTFLTIGGRGSVSYPWADYTDLTLSYKHEAVRTGDDPIWEPIDSVRVGIHYDDVNNPLFPTLGNRRTLSVEKAGGFAPGVEFSKLDLSWIHFAPLYLPFPFLEERDQVLAIRLALGWGTDLPDSQAYTLGGSTTIRGTTTSSIEQLCYANVEYRLKIVEGLTGTLFFDSGVDLSQVGLSGAKSSVGIEIGIEAVGMYVRLDMAWLLGPEFEFVPHFDFGFGPMF
jgi:outer membrane protein assembly factor BamA